MLITGSWVPIETLLIASLQTTPGKWLFGCFIQFSISDAYAPRDMRSQIERGFKRALRVWWEGVGCGFPLLAPILIAVAYEKVAQNQETDWDFALDCLVTHGPPGALNLVTGVCGLAAMLWLYGVAWHQPMAQSFAWARTSLTAALPSPTSLVPGSAHRAADGAPSENGGAATSTIAAGGLISTPPPTSRGGPSTAANGPIDPAIDAQFAERRAKMAALKDEGTRMLREGNWRRAGELCRAWTDIDLANADAWRCLGQAMQAQGNHKEAVNAFRKAKQYDPADRTLDAAIDRSQKGIVADFLGRYQR
jgi:hypothetical protein